jgi:NAD(P)H-hydrate epimerase
MSMQPISVAAARAVDRDAVLRLGMPSILLMENAARSVAEEARRMGDRYLIYCGPGNNGGDGLAAARHLGRGARAYLISEPAPDRCPDAALQLSILRNAGVVVPVGELPPYAEPGDVVIDAMFGTGLARDLDGTAAEWVERFNASPGRKLAVDIPSGLHGDSGEVLGVACRVETTVTFVAPKLGLVTAGAPQYVGRLVVVGLGLPHPPTPPNP